MTADTRSCSACKTPLPIEAHFCLNCGTPTPTEPGVPPRTMPTGAVEVSRVRTALASRYRIDHVLGEGGMATVYLAEDLKHHRKVAVKVMRPELAETLGAERFLREVEIAARLSHPHILPVYDSGSADGILYYVMPLVEGESLPARLAREKQLPVGEAVRLAREVAEALAYAHQHGFVHRDIKPANILLSGGHALVADFGIARAMSSDGRTITKTGLAIGTPHYMSPEQASGAHEVDGRTDIYALGCVLYEMLAGEPPFTGPTAQAIISRSITETARPLEQTRVNLSPAVSRAVTTAMAKSPADRYASAGEMAAALQGAEDAVRTGATATPASGARFGWRHLVVAGLLLVALGAAAASVFRMGGGGNGAGANGTVRLAILPFENQGNPDDAYFGDGVVDEVRGKLAKVQGLAVIASSSSEPYRSTTKSSAEIAAELGVDYLLVGKVRWLGGEGSTRRVQVVPELIDAKTGSVTWQEPFDATLTDLFQMQATMAARVAGALGRVLGRSEQDLLAERPTTNAEAYQLYLQAKAIQDNGAVAQRRAASLLEQAVALDANFAEAWALLANAWARVYANGQRDVESGRRAGEAVDRATALKPNSAETHLARGRYLSLVAVDVPRAIREMELAVEAEPNNAEALANLASLLMSYGEAERARGYVERARALDPRSPIVATIRLRVLIQLGEFETAKTAGHEALALSTDDIQAVQDLAIAYASTDDLAGARAMIRDAMRQIPSTQLVAYFTGYNETGWLLEESEQQLAFRLTPSSFDDDVSWWGQALAMLAWGRGELDKARDFARQSREPSRRLTEANPADGQLRVLYAIMLAYLGENDAAIREATEGVRITEAAGGQVWFNTQYERLQLVRVLIVTGRHDEALRNLELMGEHRYPYLGSLPHDTLFEPIRKLPRFQALLK